MEGNACERKRKRVKANAWERYDRDQKSNRVKEVEGVWKKDRN